MPATLTYPGIYIEEIPSGVRTIVGVATSITAFIGRALKGSVNEPIRIQSFSDFERVFGGLWIESTMSYAVQHYFLNGGTDAIIVRIHNNATRTTLSLPAGDETLTLTLEASSEGTWGNNLRATVDHETKDKDDPSPDPDLFNLTIVEVDPATEEIRLSEKFRNVSRDSNAGRFITKVLEQESAFVRVLGNVPGLRPDADTTTSNGDGNDGDELTFTQYEGIEDDKTGIFALKKADIFNLLCIPPFTRENPVIDTTWQAARKYCHDHRAMLIVDPQPDWDKVSDVETGIDSLLVGLDEKDKNAAVFYPRLKMSDPLKENRLEEFAPCGAVAGIFARTDSQRGVWKAPAGLDSTVTGVRELSVKLSDGDNGRLNPLGVNCLRTFPGVGTVVWGARTLRGSDRLASEWKYIPVRRLALFIEESLYRGTQWVVFEPNDEPLWAQIRLNIGAFMNNLFRQGAFQGRTQQEAYFVKCDKETTIQNDINLGIVNIIVGFAPLKPAEFVIIKIQQMAGELQT